MKTTIDRAGRIVVPKTLREALELAPGQEPDIAAREGRLEIQPSTTPMTLRPTYDGPVAVPQAQLPPLTADLVRDTLEQVRR